MQKNYWCSFLIFTLLLTATAGFGQDGYEIYVTIEGAKQGKLRGESTREAHKDKLTALGFSYGVSSPRDVASGMATGKRQHMPVTFVKKWGAATPQLFQAAVTNEVLKTVLFEFVQTNTEGEEEIFHTVKLTNAAISKIEQTAGQLRTITPSDAMDLETISLRFQAIEMENKIGKTSASDSRAGGR